MRFCIVCFFCFFFCSSCTGGKEKECDTLLKKSTKNLNSYYETQDQNFLIEAKKSLDSVDCKSFEYKIFNTKTAVLLLLKEYKEGIRYISSLDSAYFEKSYTKQMYLNNFKALDCQHRGDTIQRNKYYSEILSTLHLYLDKHPTDKESLYEYYNVKKMFSNRTEVIKEIDSLKLQKRYDVDFLDACLR